MSKQKLTAAQKKRAKELREHKKSMANNLRLLAEEVEDNGQNLDIKIEINRWRPVTAEQIMKREEGLRNGYIVEISEVTKFTINWMGTQL